MIIVSAICLVMTSTVDSNAYYKYLELSSQLNHNIEWIDRHGSSTLSRSEAAHLLDQYAIGLDHSKFTIRHSSNWKNDQCFKIIHVNSQGGNLRIFFQCAKINEKESTVVKVKITSL